MARGQKGPWPPHFFEIFGFSKLLMFHRNVFVLLLLVKIKILNFIRKYLNLAPLMYMCHDAPVLGASASIFYNRVYCAYSLHIPRAWP